MEARGKRLEFEQAVTERLAHLQRELIGMDIMCAERERLATMSIEERDERIVELMSKNSDLEEENEAKRNRVVHIEQRFADVCKENRDICEVRDRERQRGDFMKEQKDRMHRLLTEAEEKAEAERLEHEQVVERYHETNESLQADVARLDEQETLLHDEVMQLMAERDALKKENGHLEAGCSNIMAECERLKKLANKWGDQNATLEDQNRHLCEHMESQAKILQATKDENRGLKISCGRHKAKAERLSAKGKRRKK